MGVYNYGLIVSEVEVEAMAPQNHRAYYNVKIFQNTFWINVLNIIGLLPIFHLQIRQRFPFKYSTVEQYHNIIIYHNNIKCQDN